MTENATIIDVEPIHHSSSRIGAGRARASRSTHSQGDSQARGRTTAAENAKGWSPSTALAGIAQMALGAGLVAIGIPMLILPGPGLISIGAGVVLAARGLSKVTGRQSR